MSTKSGSLLKIIVACAALVVLVGVAGAITARPAPARPSARQIAEMAMAGSDSGSDRYELAKAALDSIDLHERLTADSRLAIAQTGSTASFDFETTRREPVCVAKEMLGQLAVAAEDYNESALTTLLDPKYGCMMIAGGLRLRVLERDDVHHVLRGRIAVPGDTGVVVWFVSDFVRSIR